MDNAMLVGNTSNHYESGKRLLFSTQKTFYYFFICFLLLWAIPMKCLAASEILPESRKSLIIGVKQSPPFSMKNPDGSWQGISIELWQGVARDLDIDYEYREYSLKELLEGLKDHTIDGAVAALTITAEREKAFDFTHPFHTSGLGIAVRTDEKEGMLGFMHRFFSSDFLKAVLSLAVLVGVVGILVWLFERKKNPDQFGGSTSHGIGAAFWWSAVTMTTVGYGDKAPKTMGGRLVAIVWMFVALVVISGFTAAITTSLTVSHIRQKVKGLSDLPHVRVGSINDSTSAQFLSEQHIPFRPYDNVSLGLSALENSELDAFVYDAPILRYVATQELSGRVSVLRTTFARQQYGIGLPSGSPLREPINQALLKIISRQEWQDTIYQYLGN